MRVSRGVRHGSGRVLARAALHVHCPAPAVLRARSGNRKGVSRADEALSIVQGERDDEEERRSHAAARGYL